MTAFREEEVKYGWRGWQGRYRWQVRLLSSARSMHIGAHLLRSNHEITLYWGVWGLFSLFLIVGQLPTKYTNLKYDDREISLSIFAWRVWIRLWGCPTGYGPQREIVLRPRRWLAGRSRVTVEKIGEERIVIPLPEAKFRARLVGSIVLWPG